jgi:hypothetical protein
MKWLCETMKQTKISTGGLFTPIENEKIPLKLAESPMLEIGNIKTVVDLLNEYIAN